MGLALVVRLTMVVAVASTADVVEAFFKVARRKSPKRFRSKWIPMEYWTHVVNEELQIGNKGCIRQRKLINMLNPFFNRVLCHDQQVDGICYVRHTKARVKRRRESSTASRDGTKVRDFICIESESTYQNKDQIEKLTQPERIQHFQQSYYRYVSLIENDCNVNWSRSDQNSSSTALATERTTNPIEATEPPANSNAAPVQPVATVTLDIDVNSCSSNNTKSQPITPISNPLDSPENADIRAILESVLNPSLLKRDDLFIGDGNIACEKLRSAMHRFGKQKQKEANLQHYRIIAANDNLSDLVDGKKYIPLLDRFCCPLNKRAIQSFLSIAVMIDEENEATQILRLPRKGGIGNGKCLVPVVPSTSRKTLQDNSRKWLPQLYKAVNVDSALDNYTISFQFILMHMRINWMAFMDVCRTKGPVAKAFKMDPHRQIAMCDQANLNYTHLRNMRPFLIADNCNPLRSEKEIRTLVVSPEVKPIFTKVEEEKTERNAWHLPVDELLAHELRKKCYDRMSYDELHIILSADHGQKMFRCNVTVVAISQNTTIKFEKHMLVGNIQCRKDTRQLLVESGVATGINDTLKKIRDSNICCNGTPVAVKMKGTGDLAWYSLALGKENKSVNHCWKCQARWHRFQDDPFKTFQPWTLQSMKEQFEKLESKEINRSNKDLECGLTHPPIFDCIEPQNWMCPVLHAVDLLANTVFDHFQKYIWYRLEDVPLELIAARIAWANAATKKEEAWQRKMDKEEHLAQVQADLSAMEDGELVDSDEEFKLQAAVVKVAKDSLALAKRQLKKREQELAKKRATLPNSRKTPRNMGKQLGRFG